MKEFFMLLFFSKAVMLTPNPITLEDQTILTPKKPISAITAGANLQIDITDFISKYNLDSRDIIEYRKGIKNILSSSNLEAVLRAKKKPDVRLVDLGISLSEDQVWVTLSSDAGVPVDVEFSSVVIKTDAKIENAKVLWKNASK